MALAGTARAQEHCAPVPGLRYHKIYDVIVVGSGFAGLAAALEAVQAGRSVLVIDKMPVLVVIPPLMAALWLWLDHLYSRKPGLKILLS